MDDVDHPLLTGGTGALDNFLMSCEMSENVVKEMQGAVQNGYNQFNFLKNIVEQLPTFIHHMSTIMVNGSATSQTSTDIQKGDGKYIFTCPNLQILNSTEQSSHVVSLFLQSY